MDDQHSAGPEHQHDTAEGSPGTIRVPCVDPLARVRGAEDPSCDVFLTGTVFLDIIFTGLEKAPVKGSEAWAAGMGSSPGGIANMATAMSRLGLRTSLSAAFGDDLYGEFCSESLAVHEGIDLSLSQQIRGWHTPVTVSMAYEGERTMVTHGHPPLGSVEIPSSVPPARACMSTLDPNRSESWVRAAHQHGSLIFADVGWDESESWSSETLTDLEYCHAFLPNAVEAMSYTRTGTPEEAARKLAERVPVAVVTKGADGAIGVDASTGEWAEAPGLPVEAMDPTGAGDVFIAGFVTGTLAGWPLQDRLLFANLVAAMSVQHFGGSLSAPGWIEIATWWQKTKNDPGYCDLTQRYLFLNELVPTVQTWPPRRAVPTIGFRSGK